jgi:hypothetical protein
VSERCDDVICEYIDFVNEQVGTYMDKLVLDINLSEMYIGTRHSIFLLAGY